MANTQNSNSLFRTVSLNFLSVEDAMIPFFFDLVDSGTAHSVVNAEYAHMHWGAYISKVTSRIKCRGMAHADGWMKKKSTFLWKMDKQSLFIWFRRWIGTFAWRQWKQKKRGGFTYAFTRRRQRHLYLHREWRPVEDNPFSESFHSSTEGVQRNPLAPGPPQKWEFLAVPADASQELHHLFLL